MTSAIPISNLDFKPFDAPLKCNGIVLVEASLSSNTETEYTQWRHDRICLVKRGQLILDSMDSKATISNSEILLLPAGVRHRWICQDQNSAALLMICYNKPYFDSPNTLKELLGSFAEVFPVLTGFSPESTIRAPTIRYLFKELIKEKRAKAKDQNSLTFSLFISLVTQLIRAYREVEDQLNLEPWEQSFDNSLKYLEENIQEISGVAELADFAGLSYRRYTDLFKKRMQTTANEYIRNKRIELAKQLLVETGNILHASLDAGFGDLAHFYRVFKQMTGMTPKQFIIQHQAGINKLPNGDR